jgi:hypothetical protein
MKAARRLDVVEFMGVVRAMDADPVAVLRTLARLLDG